ncbi:hypothetical protein A3768_0870 [Ralstonia solanacearum]|nr:hypothetical protein A3768_0870 [Ralstonia solanacearum]
MRATSIKAAGVLKDGKGIGWSWQGWGMDVGKPGSAGPEYAAL